MHGLRATFAALFTLSLATVTVWSVPPPASVIGTVIAADRAHVGQASADVGTTVYGGDRLTTDLEGSVQLRAGAARLLLMSSSGAVVTDTEGAPSANLLFGTATFSTANARAFTLHASTATIRPQTDSPTIAQVGYLSKDELIVTARRGSVSVTVEDEMQLVPEGTSYRVLLDAQGPEGAGAGKEDRNRSSSRRLAPPLKAGRSHFLILTSAAVGVITFLAVSEALESPDRP